MMLKIIQIEMTDNIPLLSEPTEILDSCESQTKYKVLQVNEVFCCFLFVCCSKRYYLSVSCVQVSGWETLGYLQCVHTSHHVTNTDNSMFVKYSECGWREGH